MSHAYRSSLTTMEKEKLQNSDFQYHNSLKKRTMESDTRKQHKTATLGTFFQTKKKTNFGLPPCSRAQEENLQLSSFLFFF